MLFVPEQPCDAGSAWMLQAAYDIVRSLTNSQKREFISLTSSLTSDSYNFTASVDTGYYPSLSLFDHTRFLVADRVPLGCGMTVCKHYLVNPVRLQSMRWSRMFLMLPFLTLPLFILN